MKDKNSTFANLRNFFIILEFEVRAFLGDKPSAIRRLFIEPIVYLIFLGAGFSTLIKGQINYNGDMISYISYIFPGILTLQMTASFSHSIYRLTVERRCGLQALKMINGTGHMGYILAMVCIPIGIFFIQLLISFPIAWILGANISAKGFLMLSLLGITVNIFWTCLAFLVVVFFKNYSSRDFFLSFSMLFLSLTAPVFYSLNDVPLYLKVLSSINPITYHVDAMRQAFLTGYFFKGFFHNLFLSIILIFLSLKALGKAEYIDKKR